MSETGKVIIWVGDALNSLMEFLEDALINIVSKVKIEGRTEGQEVLSATTDILLRIRTLLYKLDLLYAAFIDRKIRRDKALAATPTKSEIEEIEKKLVELESNPLFAELAEYRSKTGKDLEQYFSEVRKVLEQFLSGRFLHPETKDWFDGHKKPTSADKAWVGLWHIQFSLYDLAQYLKAMLLTAETTSSEDKELVEEIERKISLVGQSLERVKDLLEAGFSLRQAMKVFPEKAKEELASIEEGLKKLEAKYPTLLPLSPTEYFASLVSTPVTSITTVEETPAESDVEKVLERIIKWANSITRALIGAYGNIIVNSAWFPPKSEERQKSQKFLSAIRNVLPILRNFTFKLELLYLMRKQGDIDESKVLAAIPTESEIRDIEGELITLDDPSFAKMAMYEEEKSLSQYFFFNVSLKLVGILPDLHPKARKVYWGDEKPQAASSAWVTLWQVQLSLIDLLGYLRDVVPETEEDMESIGFIEEALMNLIKDCEKIRDAIGEKFNEDAIVAAFPVSEHLVSIEEHLAALEKKYPYALPVGNLREVFIISVYNPIVSIKNTLTELGVEGLEDKWSEAPPTALPTGEELEEEYQAIMMPPTGEEPTKRPEEGGETIQPEPSEEPLGDPTESLRAAFNKVIEIFQRYASGRTDFLTTLQYLQEDFENAIKRRDLGGLRDVRKQISLLSMRLKRGSEEAKQVEDFLSKLGKYMVELWRQGAKRLLKFKILSEVLWQGFRP